MDAYAPSIDTVRHVVESPSAEQPWKAASLTQTIRWFVGPNVVERDNGANSLGDPMTFFILDLPEFAGLERLRTFSTWGDNWDAEGAKAPDGATLDSASAIFSLVARHATPQVSLSAEGHPMLVFSGARRGEIVVTGPQTFDYFFSGEDAPFADEVQFAGALPVELVNYLRANNA